ncbi:MAG: PEP-CTERM sorting domain-containing protein [Chthoniobacteraceae bacterium]
MSDLFSHGDGMYVKRRESGTMKLLDAGSPLWNKESMRKWVLVLVMALASQATLQAAVIAYDGFNYANGSISGQSGGIGWSQSGGVSSWSQNATVSSGTLTTNGTSAIPVSASRTFGGNEAASALSITGTYFFRITLTFGATVPYNVDFTLSSFDGSTQKQFGVTNNLFFYSSTYQSYGSLANSTHTLVGVIDYANGWSGLFVDPDNSDYYSTTGGTMDIKYQSVPTASFSRITLSSSDNYPYSVAWDDVEVTTTFAEAMTIPAPEPSSVSLVLLGFGWLLRRRGA